MKGKCRLLRLLWHRGLFSHLRTEGAIIVVEIAIDIGIEF